MGRIEDHYKSVSDQFGIDASAIHSWHAGIHPGCDYKSSAADDPDRWSNTVFTNPRFLHIHTCGAYAPGEICWMLLDHSIAIDGTKLWDGGRLMPGAFEQTATCLEKWPGIKPLFDNPAQGIGL